MKKIFQCFCLILLFTSAICFAQTKEPIRVGVFLDMSGQTASFGAATYNGIKLAVSEINSSGGIEGRKIELYLEDDKGDPGIVQTVVEKLIFEKKVHALIGEVASTNSLAAAPIAEKAKIPMITPSSTNPKVNEANDYIFRACFIDPFQGEAMAKFAFNELKLRRIAILGDVNSEYSKGLSLTFTKTFTELGGKIIIQQTYAQTDSDYKVQLKTIRKQNPDAIYLSGYYGQVGAIAGQAREMKINVPLLGGDGWDSPEIWKLGGKALENSYITNHFAFDNPSAKIRQFTANYESKFKIKPDSLAALGYDATNLLADALRRAKSTEGYFVRDALAETKNFSGVTGNITMNGAHNAVKPVIILKTNLNENQFVYRATIEP